MKPIRVVDRIDLCVGSYWSDEKRFWMNGSVAAIASLLSF